jgi:hypothetical protein
LTPGRPEPPNARLPQLPRQRCLWRPTLPAVWRDAQLRHPHPFARRKPPRRGLGPVPPHYARHRLPVAIPAGACVATYCSHGLVPRPPPRRPCCWPCSSSSPASMSFPTCRACRAGSRPLHRSAMWRCRVHSAWHAWCWCTGCCTADGAAGAGITAAPSNRKCSCLNSFQRLSIKRYSHFSFKFCPCLAAYGLLPHRACRPAARGQSP